MTKNTFITIKNNDIFLGPPPVPSKPDLVKNLTSAKRQEELEVRHQELLARQRQLQVYS